MERSNKPEWPLDEVGNGVPEVHHKRNQQRKALGNLHFLVIRVLDTQAPHQKHRHRAEDGKRVDLRGGSAFHV